MIFISHTHADKPVIEPIAIRLMGIFGQNKVFYDSWSIQPGDSIIDKMNDGLTSPRFVFFFVSTKSLTSNMVKLEWQNALFKATKGQCKIIPVRVDGCQMPPVLLQSLYIDLFSIGIEATIVQMVNVIQGNNTFTPQHAGFSNLTYTVSGDPSSKIDITISASHLMEPNPNFLVLVTNSQSEINFELNGGAPYTGGFAKDVRLNNGVIINGIQFAPLGGAITPAIPMIVTLKATGSKPVDMKGVLHRKTLTNYEPIPKKN